jgi:hypothetical protein
MKDELEVNDAGCRQNNDERSCKKSRCLDNRVGCHNGRKSHLGVEDNGLGRSTCDRDSRGS